VRPLELSVLPETYAISRLDASAPEPGWAQSGQIRSVTRTAQELSIVCLQDAVPGGVVSEGGWRVLKVKGPLDFSLTGILASLAAPLAQARVSLFALSTHDTDYVLVKSEALQGAIAALTAAGHRFAESS
jgi:uncharacterized protein